MAHSASRNSENSIAGQLAQFQPDVLMGGGWQYFLPADSAGSKRIDEKNLVAEFLAAGRARNLFWETTARAFDGIEIFAPTTFRWNWAWMSTMKKYMIGLYWSFYSVRFESRIPAKISAAEAW